MALIAAENFLPRWVRRLVNRYKYALEKVVIMLRNKTLYICYRLLYMK